MSASQSWWQVIQESLQAQNWPVAEGALRRLLEVNPDHLELLDLLGYSLLMQARYSESELYLRKALENPSHNFWTPHKLGDALRGLQRMDEAVYFYEQALLKGSDSSLTIRNLLQVLDALNTESALKRLEQLATKKRKGFEEGAIEAALASSSPELAVLVCKLGSSNEAVRAKAYTQALSELNLTSLQNLLIGMNDQFSCAVRQRLKGATTPTINYMLPRLEDAAQLRIDGYPEKSLIMIEQHLQNGEANDWWLDNKARALVMLGRRIEAIEIWEKLLQSSDPDLITVSSQMLLIQRTFILKPLEDAVQLRIDGYPEKSLNMIEQHLQNGEANDWWLDNKARALVMLNRRIEAIEIWKKLLQSSDPDLITVSSQMLLVQTSFILKPLMDYCKSANWPTEFLDQGQEGKIPLLDSILLEISKLALADRNFIALGLANHAIQQGMDSPWLLLAKAEALQAIGKNPEATYWFNILKKSRYNEEFDMIIRNKNIKALL